MAQSNSKQPVIQNSGVGGSHSRSLSQPAIFSNSCLPPLSPLPHSESSNSSLKDVSMEEMDVTSRGPRSFVPAFTRENNMIRGNESLPPRKGHRRSSSDTDPLAFSTIIQSSPQLVPISGHGSLGGFPYARDGVVVKNKPVLLQRKETGVKNDSNKVAEGMGERKSDGEVIDKLFNSYMSLDRMDAWNPSAGEDKDKDCVISGTRSGGGESSNTEAESDLKGNSPGIYGTGLREGVKRTAAGDIALTSCHFRSRSMDSAFGSLNLADESSKLPVFFENCVGHLSPGDSGSDKPATFSLEFGNGEFSEAELKKIILDEKLAEIAISDPKRAKRILANRQSAARSKERKLRYISELEYKVQTLQTEATTMSAQLTNLQKDYTELTSQNNELKFRLQAMEQQAHLRDALHEALTAEVQRLKLKTQEISEEARASECFPQQTPMKHQQPNQRHQLSAATSTEATGSTAPASA